MSDKHPNLLAIERLFTAYGAGDVKGCSEILHPEITWAIPGHHPLAGVKRGLDEVLAFFDQLAKAKFMATPRAIAVSGDYVLDFHRGWSDAGSGIDLEWCLVFRFEGGRIREVTNFCFDQHAADLFFWSTYKLKPLPDRLEA